MNDTGRGRITQHSTGVNRPYLGSTGASPARRGHYAWGQNATATGGGIMIDKDKIDDFRTTFTHEVGHNLRLSHTHHGWFEVRSTD